MVTIDIILAYDKVGLEIIALNDSYKSISDND